MQEFGDDRDDAGRALRLVGRERAHGGGELDGRVVGVRH